MNTPTEQHKWLAGLLTGWGIKESWAKLIAGAIIGACAAAGLPGRLIPVPREITAGCGMSWKAAPEDRAALEAFVAEKGITVAGFYELML